MREKTPEEKARELSLKQAAALVHFATLDEARAFAAELDQTSSERLVQACLEKGRPQSLLIRKRDSCG